MLSETVVRDMTYKQLTDELHDLDRSISMMPKGRYRNDMLRHYQRVLRKIKKKQREENIL